METSCLNLEQYCSQTVRDLRCKASLPIDNNESKITVMVQAAKSYLEKKLIDKTTYDVVTDERYIRLFSLRVTKLKEMLRSINIDPPPQGKAKIAILCYEQGLDGSGINSSSMGTDVSLSANDDIINSEAITSTITDTTGTTGAKFIFQNDNIYFTDGNSYTQMTYPLIQQLMALMWHRR